MQNTKSEKKIAVIGKEDVISCFNFVGFETRYITSNSNFNETISDIRKNISDYAIIFITENYYDLAKEHIDKINKISLTSIVLIPDNTGSKNKASQILSNATEQAVGSDILK